MPAKLRKSPLAVTRAVGKDRRADETTARKTIDATAGKPVAGPSALPASVAVVDGYKVYQSAVEPVHITREQIARAIAAVK